MPTDSPVLFMSLKPRFAELILSGEKTVELRRVKPTVCPGALIVFYASSPTREVVGWSRISDVEAGAIDVVWSRHGSRSGLTRAEYDSYFEGINTAVAISLIDVHRRAKGIPLAELRRRWSGFNPPQSYRYIDAAQAAGVL